MEHEKNLIPLIGVSMVAGAALGMALKPQKQDLKHKVEQAVRTVGSKVEQVADSMGL